MKIRESVRTESRHDICYRILRKLFSELGSEFKYNYLQQILNLQDIEKSETTIRRYIDQLKSDFGECIQVTPGGVKFVNPLRHDHEFLLNGNRFKMGLSKKLALAKSVVLGDHIVVGIKEKKQEPLVKNGDKIFLGNGTTIAALADRIFSEKSLTDIIVYTNALTNYLTISRPPSAYGKKIIFLPGVLNIHSLTLEGGLFDDFIVKLGKEEDPLSSIFMGITALSYDPKNNEGKLFADADQCGQTNEYYVRLAESLSSKWQDGFPHLFIMFVATKLGTESEIRSLGHYEIAGFKLEKDKTVRVISKHNGKEGGTRACFVTTDESKNNNRNPAFLRFFEDLRNKCLSPAYLRLVPVENE